MLIVLDDSLIKTSSTAEFKLLLSSVFTAAQCRRHLFLVHPSLSKSFQGTDSDRMLLRTLSLRWAQTANLVENVEKSLIIRDSRKSVEVVNNKVLVSLDFIVQNLTLLDSPILICEDESDCHFYVKFTELYCSKEGLGKFLRLDFSIRNGGGANTQRTWTSLRNSSPEKVILCVVDSDKACFACSEGPTALKFTDRSVHEFSFLKILNQHREVENLIPPFLLECVFTPKELVLYKKLNNEQKCFVDLKKTIRTNKRDCTHSLWVDHNGNEFNGKKTELRGITSKNIELMEGQHELFPVELKEIINIIFSYCLASNRALI